MSNDYGPNPCALNLQCLTLNNSNFRTALWTGNHLQVTIMNIKDEIGLERHFNLDQLLYIEDGCGFVTMGETQDMLNIQQHVRRGSTIFIPSGTWHNLVNTGSRPIKLFSVYAPVQHPHGTIHRTRADSEAAEQH